MANSRVNVYNFYYLIFETISKEDAEISRTRNQSRSQDQRSCRSKPQTTLLANPINVVYLALSSGPVESVGTNQKG